MTMITCTRKLHFCAGHRVMGHENKCAHLHGHNFLVEITAVAQATDSVARVVDFSVLKATYDPWIQQHWDHGFLLNSHDEAALRAVQGFLPRGVSDSTVQKIYQFPDNPTAEGIAKFLGTHDEFVQALAPYGVTVCKVVVHETPNCFATWEPSYALNN